MPKRLPSEPISKPVSLVFALILFGVAYGVAWSLADSYFTSWMLTTDVRMVRLVLALIAVPIWLVLCLLLSQLIKLMRR